jgi:rubredoxin
MEGCETVSELPEKLLCTRCKVEMQPAPVQFSYLKRMFKHTVLRCPSCGQVFIPESLAEGRMREVEAALEDK